MASILGRRDVDDDDDDDNDDEEALILMYDAVMRKEWEVVSRMFENHPHLHAAKITYTGDTVLHLAIILGAPKRTVLKLLHIIHHHHYHNNNNGNNVMEVVAVKNKTHDTPLHYAAASRGCRAVCEAIIRLVMLSVSRDHFHHQSLVFMMRNKHGETPLFLAALNGHKRTFCYLHSVFSRIGILSASDSDSALWRRSNNGETILHASIRRQHFELAYMIIHLYKAQNIASSVDENGITPLEVLVSIPSAFKTGTQIKWWHKLCYHYINVRQLSPPAMDSHVIEVENYDVDISYDDDDDDEKEYPKNSNRGSLKRTKEKHVWCKQILEELVKQNSHYVYDENVDALEHESRELLFGDDDDNINKRWTALLIAAKHGLMEPIEKILREMPMAVFQKNRENENIVLVAVRERQTFVLKLLMEEHNHLWVRLREEVDNNGNNALHLAANLSTLPWKIPGSALQMLWEIKWFEYVKKNMPDYLMSEANKEGKTAEEIFVSTHKNLVEESSKWLHGTAKAYSLIATITASVTFAAAIQVPGGNNDTTGEPILQGQPLFRTFNVATLVAFCFSLASLAIFLSILTSRKKPQDFKVLVPMMLVMGLVSFFASVVSMLVAFCTAHSFEYEGVGALRNQPVSLYALTLIPLSFYALPQVPLCWIILKASFATLPLPKYRGQVVSL